MATASVNRMMLWTDLEGRELEGKWRLGRLVRPEGRNAWFEATGPDGKPAMVSLTEALNDEDELLARLHAAATVRHPNVVAVHEALLTDVEETPVVAAAMEPTDENLGDVLRERTLDAVELLPLMDALLQGLAAIHGKRLTHGRMEPASVLAMGDTVKLRSDCLHMEGFAARAGEDVRGLGRIVTQAMTRRIPANENDPVLQLLPEPLGRAVRRALSGNASVEEVAALAGTKLAAVMAPTVVKAEPKPEVRTPEPPSKAEVKVPEPGRAPALKPEGMTAEAAKAEAATSAEKKDEEKKPGPVEMPAVKVATTILLDSARAAKPGQMDLPLMPRRVVDLEDDEDEARSWSWVRRNWDRGSEMARKGKWGKLDRLWKWEYHRVGARWIVGAAVVLVLATVLVVHGLMHRSSSAASEAPSVTAASQAVASPRVVVQHGAAPARAAAGAVRDWRVVVYTYRRRSEAQQRAAAITGRHPELQAGVLATRGGAYLVTVGGAMTREEAFAERGKAVRMGMPRDSYAQNFR